jgi:uncharacterized protein YfaS (alpha-2-macroglobulin family)
MKQIKTAFLITFILFCFYPEIQTKDKPRMEITNYKTAWNEVQNMESRNLPESALNAANAIYEKAVLENNAQQIVKGVFHILKYTEYKQEESFVKNLNRMESEVVKAKFPAKQILHSMLAQMYWNYYQANRYNFSQRSETAGFDNKDIATWSLEKIVKETFGNYQLSLEEADKSKAIKIDLFDEILYGGNKKGRAYRPTLYDFLAHRAVDFFMSTEPDIIKPAYAFSINSADYLKDAADFCRLNIASEDKLSSKYNALKIFQDLIKFHLNDGKIDSLIDVDLKRVNFVHQHLTTANKDEPYLKALKDLEQKSVKSQISLIAGYYIAQFWQQSGSKYMPLQSDEHKWDLKKAFDISEDAIKRFPNSYNAGLLHNFKTQMLYKHYTANIEKINVPDKPFRALIDYKNIPEIYWTAVKVTREEVLAERKKWEKDYNVDRERKFIEHFISSQPVKTGKAILPDDKDLQMHSAEIKIDDLPLGDYMIFFSANPDLKIPNNQLYYSFTTISILSYIHRNLPDGSTDFYVLDRTTGNPVADAGVNIFFYKYNSKSNKYDKIDGGKFTSNNDGYIKIPFRNKKKNDYYERTFFADIKYKNDKISSQDIDSYNNNYNGNISQNVEQKERVSSQTLFFLDRAIYRPGQTLYFKGLLYKTDGRNAEILPNVTRTVTFFDVNSQAVDKKQVKTNEYGTFSGSFTTPSSGLLGQMYLQIDDYNTSSIGFSVEEYKRPKFEAAFDPVKGSFRLGETIKTTGKATAFSGANISSAKVKYRVVRQARFPYWWWYWYGYYPPSPEMQISTGETVTDADGKFKIDFNAIPDEGVDKKSSPIFDYLINADITDINGETHNAYLNVSVGYVSLVAEAAIENIDAGSDSIKKAFNIRTTNLMGEFEPAAGTIKIWKLKNPERAFRSRYWHQPDKYTLRKDEYDKLFPNDLYADESNFYKWPKYKELFSQNFNTANKKEFSINDLASWQPGKYMLEINSKDKYGENVKGVTYFDVTNSKSTKLALPEIFRLQAKKSMCEPGEAAIFQAGSSENINALYEVEHDGKIISGERLHISNEKRTLEIPIIEKYRGNIAVHLTFIKDNRFYNTVSIVTVLFTNKELDIKFETFRDKLQPGQNEQWKLKISAKKADKVMAEMVAALYDASLDTFVPNNWYAGLYFSSYARLNWFSQNNFQQGIARSYQNEWNVFSWKEYSWPDYDSLNWFGYNFYNNSRNRYSKMRSKNGHADEAEAPMAVAESSKQIDDIGGVKDSNGLAFGVEKKNDGKNQDKEEITNATKSQDIQKNVVDGSIKIRKNFNETAFFYPHLETDKNGEIIINFTIPEALTRWKMLGFAHTKDLKTGFITNELVTQKDLMVVPNQPRFFRENDKIYFTAKVVSLVDKEILGNAQLEFFDALTMKTVDDLMNNREKQKPFTIKAKQSSALEWNIEIPEGMQAVVYRITAKSGDFSDGEEMTLPVVTNRMLVTETLPLPIRGKEQKSFRLTKFADNKSATLKNYKYTLEFTSNPAWYAVQALPYIMEYPYECVEQTFSRFYANSIASHIVNSNPKTKRIFDTWRNIQPQALLSNLEKNQELKSALLEETPWVLEAKDESQHKRNIALLFDMNKMSSELGRALTKIIKAQTGNGGFTWFPGFPEDQYITQHIVAGMGHLDVMGVKSVRDDNVKQMIARAIGYLDYRIKDRYNYLRASEKKKEIDLKKYRPDYLEIHYLYTRSYFKDHVIQDDLKEAHNFFADQAKKYWMEYSIYMQGMIALSLHRYGHKDIQNSIIKSLNERALHSDEMGMYWKYDTGYFWYQAPIETQALMIELYDEVAANSKAVEDLKLWLLKQKQTQDWKTTKATVEACYALLRRGLDMLASDALIDIKVGNITVDPKKLEGSTIEAGTGYFKTAWHGSEITSDMSNIVVSKKDEGPAWGAVYWQYFEQLDKITPAKTPLSLNKKLFIQKNTDRGPVITPITGDKVVLKVGDLIKVRIELRSDRDMEYLHLKDMRASAFEPVETLSTYKFQDGLYYYHSPRDLSMNFFIGWLPKGTYVFEYQLRVSQKGDFSNGITSIQCMYAPEFSSHSEGVRVKVE